MIAVSTEDNGHVRIHVRGRFIEMTNRTASNVLDVIERQQMNDYTVATLKILGEEINLSRREVNTIYSGLLHFLRTDDRRIMLCPDTGTYQLLH